MAVAPNEIQKHLRGLGYPASKSKLIETARQEGAGPEIIGLLQKFPDREFGSPKEVMQAYGEVRRSDAS